MNRKVGMDWKNLLIIGLGILSIVVLYYCYKKYNSEGFQSSSTGIVSSDIFIGSTVSPQTYTFDNSVVGLRYVIDTILNKITDYTSFSGISYARSYSYNSIKYKQYLTITDFSYSTGLTGARSYWYPFTGQYGATGIWENDFLSSGLEKLDLNIYNSNIDRYKRFIQNGSGNNISKFLYNRSFVKPSLLYSNIDVSQPPTQFDIVDISGRVVDFNLTEINAFYIQSWWSKFTSYATPGRNLYLQSEYQTDSSYRIVYMDANDKPATLSASNLTGYPGGKITNLIPDYTSVFDSIQNEKLELNVYGTMSSNHINNFKECMFWGAVIGNINNAATIDSILCVPWNGIIDGRNSFYSFNLFKPEFTPSYTGTTFTYEVKNTNVIFNDTLRSLRSGNNICKLSDSQFANIITNINTYTSLPKTPIANFTDGFVGQINSNIMAKIPNLANRYITSWVYNRSVKYLELKPNPFTGSNITENDLSKVKLLSLAITNAYKLFLFNFANYEENLGINNTIGVDKFSYGNYAIREDARLSNVPNQDVCKRFVASSRIYNTYVYDGTSKICFLSKIAPTGTATGTTRIGGALYANNIRNYFRSSSATETLTGDIIEIIRSSLSLFTSIISELPIYGFGMAKQELTAEIRNNIGSSMSDKIIAANTNIINAQRIGQDMKNKSNTISYLFDTGDNPSIENALTNVNQLLGLLGSSTDGSTNSFYRYLSNINSLNMSITDTTLLENRTIENINKNFNMNKIFTSFYFTNFSSLVSMLNGIQKSMFLVKSINDAITDPATKDAAAHTNLTDAISSMPAALGMEIVSAITTVRDSTPSYDSKYTSLVGDALEQYKRSTKLYTDASSLLGIFSSLLNSTGRLNALRTALTTLQTNVGSTTRFVDAISATTDKEMKKIKSDFDNAVYNNKLTPYYGDLGQLKITDEKFLNSIAQKYYESSDGLYEMTTIYDVYMVGSNMVDIRFDKKQRLPNARINSLTIQYMPQVQEYNTLLDIMDNGSWRERFPDSTYRSTDNSGQILTSNGIDKYYEALSTAKGKLEPIFNPIYPVNININVKDLQTQLSNYIASNTILDKVISGRLTGDAAPRYPETQTTVGLNYSDRLKTIQYEIEDKIYTIETQISGILQGCARVFITPIFKQGDTTTVEQWRVDGLAIGINASLTYNRAYNGNFEIDMGNTNGNIGAYQPTIIYTKNVIPPIICGDLKFINKAAALFSGTAFLNLSSFTSKITGDDITKRQASDTNWDTDIRNRSSNFYDSNDGQLYIDKILGFQQINSKTCYYKWQETQYDPLTNGPFIDSNGLTKQRTVNVQYQFTYDNSEYQNPILIVDNNIRNTRPNEGFKYLSSNVNIPFGDLYMSLYTWYASATRDLYTYSNTIQTELNTISNTYYSDVINIYNNQEQNLSNYNTYQTQFMSTNINIKNLFNQLIPTLTTSAPWEANLPSGYRPIIVNGATLRNSDPILVAPPVINDDLETLTYNFRPGDADGKTAYNNGTSNYIYNKYRRVNISYFISTVILSPTIVLNGTGPTTNTIFGAYTVNQSLYQPAPPCDPQLQIMDPESCFTEETDRCKYQYSDGSIPIFQQIISNIGVRDTLKNSILTLDQQIRTNTINISTIMSNQINYATSRDIISRANKTQEQLYPIISNVNDRITYLSSEMVATSSNINSITLQYNTLNATQQTDANIRTYMTNREIPVFKELPEEALFLDDENGACGNAYNCLSIDVMNSLMDQYNLNDTKDSSGNLIYDDTILRILKGATPNKYQCDYLVEVRKKNAGIPTSIQVRYLKLIPIQPNASQSSRGIYFYGSNYRYSDGAVSPGYYAFRSVTNCLTLGNNNFSIDWFQNPIFDSENPNPIVFSILNRALSVSYQMIDLRTVTFNLYINNTLFKSFSFNYNELNRWVYIAIVRFNNVITCYKDGFAFISQPITASINGITSSTMFYIGNDGSNVAGTFFKGAIQNFSYNNYDALYTTNFFNSVPTGAIKNVNTKFILQAMPNGNIGNILNRNISKSTSVNLVNVNDPSILSIVDQIASQTQTILTNGSFLQSLYTGDNNCIVGNSSGIIYICDNLKNCIYRSNIDGTYSVIAGSANGTAGTSVASITGQASVNFLLRNPTSICLSASGILYIADTGNKKILFINGNNIYDFITFTGTTAVKYMATRSEGGYDFLYYIYNNNIYKKRQNLDPVLVLDISAFLVNPSGISFDASGFLYVADTGNHRIVKINLTSTPPSYMIVAGQQAVPTDATHPLGDGGIATSATLKSPMGVSVDANGNIYIADTGNNRVRMVNGTNIYTIAGNGTASQVRNGYGTTSSITPVFINAVSSDTIYISDTKSCCLLTKQPIPSKPTSYLYNFSPPTTINSINFMTIGELNDSDFVFQNDFTIQWFMKMRDSGAGSQNIFMLENASYTTLGIKTDIRATLVTFTIYINNTPFTVILNRAEVIDVWSNFAFVQKDSTINVYKNGISILSYVGKLNNNNCQLTIGNGYTKNTLKNFYGFITNFNILNGTAYNYNNTFVAYNYFYNSSQQCMPNLVLSLGTDQNIHMDYSYPIVIPQSGYLINAPYYPVAPSYMISELNVYNNGIRVARFADNFNSTSYNNYLDTAKNPIPINLNIGSLVNINQFTIKSGRNPMYCLQQWRLLGSPDNLKWYELHSQLTPYSSRSGVIYPKEVSFTEVFSLNTQTNIGGDIITMTKNFKVGRNINDCTMVITSNVSYDDEGYPVFSPGVTSSNAYYIQENTPYTQDSSGTDVSGYQYVGGLFDTYNTDVANIFDPIITSANTMNSNFLKAYSQSRSGTYEAIGKLNTTGFNCASFQDYDTLHSYMLSHPRFTDTIFDSYRYSNAYMSNIIRFAIADSNLIDVIFTKDNLASDLSVRNTTTSGARYRLAVTQGFCDLAASFVSDIIPFGPTIRNVSNPLFNAYPDNSNNIIEESLDIVNSRGITYKDRLNNKEKMSSATTLTAPTVSATLPVLTLPVLYDPLTGLRNIVSSNAITGVNRVEYLLNIAENVPISKKCFIVQYVNATTVYNVVGSSMATTSFKKPITTSDIPALVTAFKAHFNGLYLKTSTIPFNSLIRKVYGASITNNILTISVAIEYTIDVTTIYYNKLPNIQDFGNEMYYTVAFKTDGTVLGFEPTAKVTLPAYATDNSVSLLGGDRTTYVNNLLWTKMKFSPQYTGPINSYSISQLNFYNDENKVRIDLLNISGGNTTNFDFYNLIDGANLNAQLAQNVTSFQHTYAGGDLIATFNDGAKINGFSFMTGWSYYNPQKWIVYGSCDGQTFVELHNKTSGSYTTIIGTNYVTSFNPTYNYGYVSFYKTNIFSFIGLPDRPSSQTKAITSVPEANTIYHYLRIKAETVSLRYQITNISLYNNQSIVPVQTDTADPTNPSNGSLQYLFNFNNVDRSSPVEVKTFEADTSYTLIIRFRNGVPFNGLSFISGMDRDKCMIKWIIDVSTDTNGTNWSPFLNQTTSYTNDITNYPHYFCRTPIFYIEGPVIETSQIALYKTLSWPVRYVRFKPSSMVGLNSGEFFELSQFEFFNSTLANPKVNPPTSSTNNNLLHRSMCVVGDVCAVRTRISDLPNYRGSYYDSSTNVILFTFTSDIHFDGFSFMSGSSQYTCIQMWSLEVSTDGTTWALVHTNEGTPYQEVNYPSAYYRLPKIYFDKNVDIISNVKYYLVTGNPTDPNNNGTIYPIDIYYSAYNDQQYVSFNIVNDDSYSYYGNIILYDPANPNGTEYDSSSAIQWDVFNMSSTTSQTIYYRRTYPDRTSTGSQVSNRLYSLNYMSLPTRKDLKGFIISDKPNDIPPIIRNTTLINIYVNTTSASGAVIDTNSTFYLNQIDGWTRPIQTQGFTNPFTYIQRFILQTNKGFDIKLFKLIGSNNKPISRIFYTIESRNKTYHMIRLNAYVEIIGYSITTGLYTRVSDPDSWKLFGLKKYDWILLDRQMDIDIPVERSYPMNFYFGRKAPLKRIVEEEEDEDEVPDLELIKKYYTTKVNPYHTSVFKQYKFDDNKTCYVVYDEYDNNESLIGKNLIIGFVFMNGKITKPILYQSSEGNYEAFDLSNKDVMKYWKKNIGLDLVFENF